MMDSDLKVTESQAEAVVKIINWFRETARPSARKFFKVGGSAGTGKTTIIKFILDALGLKDDEYAACAFTGKASNILELKGIDNVSTLHKLIYTLEDIYDPVKKKIFKKFVKKKGLAPNIRLIIVDEASMISEEYHKDLLSFKRPVLYLGDCYQLPPIKGSFNLMDEKGLDYKLTEIHRQATESPIIKIAQQIIDGGDIPYGRIGNDFIKLPYDELDDGSLIKADQVICGFNKVRDELNSVIRELKGFKLKEPPQNGEKLIFRKNNYMLGVTNGQAIRLVEDAREYSWNKFIIKYVKEYLAEEYLEKSPIAFKKLNDSSLEESLEGLLSMEKFDIMETIVSKANLVDQEFSTKDKRDHSSLLNTALAEYAYAITTHLSQGSSYDKLLVVDDGFARKMPELRRKWLYTAVTRASKKLIIATY